MNRPRFTIVIPCYNGASVICRTLESILSQTFIDFECLIINDSSTDKTLETIDSFTKDKRISVISLARNSGVHMARNKGIEQAQGEFILFLDTDDELFSEALEVFNECISNNPSAGLVFANYVTPLGKISGLNVPESGFVSYLDLISLKFSREIKPSVPLVRAELAKRFRFKSPNTDFIFYRYVMRETSVYCMTNVLGKYNIEDNQDSLHIQRMKPNVKLSIQRANVTDSFLSDFKSDYINHCPYIYSKYAYGAALGLLLQWRMMGAGKRAFEAMYHSRFKLNYTVLFCFVFVPGSPALLRIFFYIKYLVYVSKDRVHHLI